jgi:hypothetical protein
MQLRCAINKGDQHRCIGKEQVSHGESTVEQCVGSEQQPSSPVCSFSRRICKFTERTGRFTESRHIEFTPMRLDADSKETTNAGRKEATEAQRMAEKCQSIARKLKVTSHDPWVDLMKFMTCFNVRSVPVSHLYLLESLPIPLFATGPVDQQMWSYLLGPSSPFTSLGYLGHCCDLGHLTTGS